ncbi:hypothetical protein WA556_005600 [Blastocystis sp. ATCC 50177/Nand II]
MGQLMSIIGLLYVRDCDTKQVVNDLTLFPPYPVFYRVDTKNGKFVGMYGIDAIENAIPDCISVTYLQVLDGISICTMHCKSKSSKKVLIVSHGNAIDNGCCISAMMLYARSLDMDCIYYDYEGFGCSDGFTSCDCLERDIRVVYDYARQFFKGEDIFLLGESMGSVPTCHLAASLYRSFAASKASGFPCEPPLGGVILNGAVYSGRELIPCCLLPNRKDPYDNAAVISSIQCPIFFIHGMNDDIIPLADGKRLYNASTSKYPPWWVPNGNHTDLLLRQEHEYLSRLSQFIEHCSHAHV